MNIKEIGEIRRRVRRDRSNMPAIYGCYVSQNKEIISEFRRSTATMSENESDKYFSLMKRSLSGSVGKNLIEITFTTVQVADSPEHKLLLSLRSSGLSDEASRMAFYRKVTESVTLQTGYLILLGCETYDVPFKSGDGESGGRDSEESYTYILCAVCPVKQTQSTLRYIPEDKTFHDGGAANVVCPPEMGFLFPAFDDRATNIYNALYYTRSQKDSHDDFVAAVFNAAAPKPAAEQKKAFESLLGSSLDEACSMDVVQTVHDELCQRIEMHRESRIPDPLLVTREDVAEVLTACGVDDKRVAKFNVEYEEVFGFEARLHPKNIINDRRFEIQTPDVSIKVAPDRTDLIETRVLGGVKYILIRAEENVEVNGVNISICQELAKV